jgi:hypothetical protein
MGVFEKANPEKRIKDSTPCPGLAKAIRDLSLPVAIQEVGHRRVFNSDIIKGGHKSEGSQAKQYREGTAFNSRDKFEMSIGFPESTQKESRSWKSKAQSCESFEEKT